MAAAAMQFQRHGCPIHAVWLRRGWCRRDGSGSCAPYAAAVRPASGTATSSSDTNAASMAPVATGNPGSAQLAGRVEVIEQQLVDRRYPRPVRVAEPGQLVDLAASGQRA